MISEQTDMSRWNCFFVHKGFLGLYNLTETLQNYFVYCIGASLRIVTISLYGTAPPFSILNGKTTVLTVNIGTNYFNLYRLIVLQRAAGPVAETVPDWEDDQPEG